MTTRAERTRALKQMPERMREMVEARTIRERLEIYYAAVRHYPSPEELDVIACDAPYWLEVKE